MRFESLTAQYGTISEDVWTGHHAHLRGWNSAYLRKDYYGNAADASQRFRLAEGTVPPNMAASLAQRKRWHKGGVEIFLGVDNQRDRLWVPPEARVPPLAAVTPRVQRFRRVHWRFMRLSWFANVYSPLYIVLLVCLTAWTDSVWIYLNPVGAAKRQPPSHRPASRQLPTSPCPVACSRDCASPRGC